MKITFVLPGIGIAGGNRAVFESSNRLMQKGHTVNIVYPLIPSKLAARSCLRALAGIFKSLLKQMIFPQKLDWFEVKVKLIRILTISPLFAGLIQSKIPDADIVVATAWETAYFVNKLTAEKGIKMYFVQHYEVWQMWNSPECWELADRIENDKSNAGSAMADIVPKDPYLTRIKNLVDATYKMPLIKFTTSSFLKGILGTSFHEKVVGTVTIGNRIEAQSFLPVKRSIKRVTIPYRGVKWKGDEDGCNALKEIKKRLNNVEFVMFGPHKDLGVPGWVTFYEKPTDEEMIELLSSSDLFVFPSWVEGYGSPPMEAMACGVACVTTNVGAVPEYAIPGETAIVVPPRNYKKLVQACIDLLINDNKRLKIAKAGFDYIKKFTWEKTVDQMEKIFLDVSSEK